MQSGPMPVAGNDPVSGALPDANSSAELGPLSPELALIDPDLARAARALLPDVQPTRLDSQSASPDSQSASPWVAELPAVNDAVSGSIESTADLGPSRPRPELGRLYWVVGLTVLGVALTLLVRSEWPLLDEQTAATPTTSPRTSTAPATTPRAATTAVTPAATTPLPAVTAKAPSVPATARTVTAKSPAPATTAAPARSTRTPPPGTTAPRTTTPTPTQPPRTPPVASSQTFAWAASPKASAYEFQLFRGTERVFRARVTEPRLVLPGKWRQDGRAESLEPGRYRWYVWTVSKVTKRLSNVATVQATLVVAARPR